MSSDSLSACSLNSFVYLFIFFTPYIIGCFGTALLLYLSKHMLNYKTGKVTVESIYRDLVLNRDDILSVSWKWVIFPKATFEMKSGETYSFLIFIKGAL